MFYGKGMGEAMRALVVAGAFLSVVGAAAGYLGGRIVSRWCNDKQDKKVDAIASENLNGKQHKSPNFKERAVTVTTTFLGACCGITAGLALMNRYAFKLNF